MVQYNMGDYTDYPKLRLAHFHHLLKLTLPIHYLSFGKLGLARLRPLTAAIHIQSACKVMGAIFDGNRDNSVKLPAYKAGHLEELHLFQ